MNADAVPAVIRRDLRQGRHSFPPSCMPSRSRRRRQQGLLIAVALQLVDQHQMHQRLGVVGFEIKRLAEALHMASVIVMTSLVDDAHETAQIGRGAKPLLDRLTQRRLRELSAVGLPSRLGQQG